MPKVDPTINLGSVINIVGLLFAMGIAWGMMSQSGQDTRDKISDLVELVEQERSAREIVITQEQIQRRESFRDLDVRLRSIETTTARAESRTEEKFNAILQTLSRLEAVIITNGERQQNRGTEH